MHILIIPSWYKNESNPVKGSFFEEQARALIKMGHKVSILFVDFKSFSEKVNIDDRDENDNGLETMYYTYQAKVPRSRRLNYYLLSRFAFKKYKSYQKRKGRPDIIHAHSVFFGGVIAKYLSAKTRIPYVVTEHLTRFITGELSNSTDLNVAKVVYKASKFNIVVSENFKIELAKKLKLNQSLFGVVHNMVSPQFLSGFKRNNLDSKKPIRFFTNSFISTRKNHELLVKAFHEFVKSYPEAELLIGGQAVRPEDLSYQDDLKKLVADLNMESNIKFLGPLSRERVKEEMDKCHAFLLSSIYETFGVVLIEALACGRPVITTNSKGPLDIVSQTDGIIVNSFEVGEFSEGMKSLILNYNNYNQEEIRENCIQRFSDLVIMNKVVDIYNAAIEKVN